MCLALKYHYLLLIVHGIRIMNLLDCVPSNFYPVSIICIDFHGGVGDKLWCLATAGCSHC